MRINWRAALRDSPAWTWDEATAQWYLHLFLPEQPDLDWGNREVVAAMHATLRFWLERGVDGFRVDVVNCLGKHPALPDLPAERARIPACAFVDEPGTHALLRGIRRVLDQYPGERVLLGEVALPWTERVATYYGEGDELHLAFNFPPLYAPWDAAAWNKCVADAAAHCDPRGAWPTWVLSNHDNRRHRTRYGSEARARAAALLLLTLRGTPVLYAGEELGLEDAVIPDGRRVDPGGRDGCRAPIPWESAEPHGWEGAEPWLPWPPEAARRSVESQRADADSILHLYRRLLATRRASPALMRGDLELLPAPEGVLAYRRRFGRDARTIVVNCSDEARAVPLEAGLRVEVASDAGGEGGPFGGTLAPAQALILA